MKKKKLKKIIKEFGVKEWYDELKAAANQIREIDEIQERDKLLKESSDLCNDILKNMGYSVGMPFLMPPKDQTKTILVDNCQECQFCNLDNEYGYNHCNLNDDILAGVNENLPKDKVHNKCPLKNMNYRIRLK